MSDDVYQMLKAIDAERDHKPEDYVFRIRYGKPWKNWRTAWQNTCARARLKDLNFHDLRHSGSFLAAARVREHALMSLLGHKTLKMTKRYIHFQDAYRRQAIQSLPTFNVTVKSSESSESYDQSDDLEKRNVVVL